MHHTPERFARFFEQLRRDLSGPLPGVEVQARMAPLPRSGPSYRGTPGPTARTGGVLVLFYPYAGHLSLPLILRPTYSGVHSGQVGFPGGGREPEDADLTATALREAYEEVGIDAQRVEVLGALTPLYIVASNYLVQPTVACTDARPDFHLDPYEVAQLLETPVAHLLDPATVRRVTWELRGRQVDVPYYDVAGQTVWGATAMMLSELLALPSVAKLL